MILFQYPHESGGERERKEVMGNTETVTDMLADDCDTETVGMADLVAGTWTADEDYEYEGYAHASRTWNGWRVCYFTDEVMARIIDDVRAYDADWHLTMVDDVTVCEVTADGDSLRFATRVIVDGVPLWDTLPSGWTWVRA